MDLTGYNSDQESRLSDQDWQVCDDNDLDSLADDSSTDDRRPQEKKAHPAVAARRSQYPRHAQTMKSSVAGTTLLETVPASSTNHAGTGMSIHMGYPILLTDIGRSIIYNTYDTEVRRAELVANITRSKTFVTNFRQQLSELDKKKRNGLPQLQLVRLAHDKKAADIKKRRLEVNSSIFKMTKELRELDKAYTSYITQSRLQLRASDFQKLLDKIDGFRREVAIDRAKAALEIRQAARITHADRLKSNSLQGDVGAVEQLQMIYAAHKRCIS